MSDVINQYAASLRRYQYHDGIGEMNMGIGMLFFAAIMWLSRVIGGWQSMLALFVGLGVLWIGTHFGARYIRSRLVYPRSGYVKVRKRPWKWALLMLLGGLLGAATTVFFFRPGTWALSPVLAVGLLMGFACLIAALRFRSKKLIAYAAISIGLGILLQCIEPQPPPDANTFWFLLNAHSSIMKYYGGMGIIWLFGGLLSLYLYTHQTPKRNLEAE